MPSVLAATLSFLALTGCSVAVPSRRTQRPCIDFTIPVAVDAMNNKWNVPRIDQAIDAADFTLQMERWSAPSLTELLVGQRHVQQTFSISATLCVPESGNKKDILQIATHGGGFAKQYWDVQYKPEEYSYVDAALKAGYSIFYYDRLGTGQSEKPDAYEIVQNGVEVEIVRQLAILARAGKLVSTKSQKHLAVPEFKKIVLVGHSMGSVYSAGALAKDVNLADGAILTGFFPSKEIGVSKISSNAYMLARSAGGRFRDRPDGYILHGPSQVDQLIFLNKGYFEPEILEYVEQIKDTDTVGETVDLPYTIATSLMKNPYKGPVLLSAGEYDYVVCDGNCTGTYTQDSAKAFFPQADVTLDLHPGAGHGLTLSTNATGHYQALFGFLNKHGL